jgi:hypothetical protein
MLNKHCLSTKKLELNCCGRVRWGQGYFKIEGADYHLIIRCVLGWNFESIFVPFFFFFYSITLVRGWLVGERGNPWRNVVIDLDISKLDPRFSIIDYMRWPIGHRYRLILIHISRGEGHLCILLRDEGSEINMPTLLKWFHNTFITFEVQSLGFWRKL